MRLCHNSTSHPHNYASMKKVLWLNCSWLQCTVSCFPCFWPHCAHLCLNTLRHTIQTGWTQSKRDANIAQCNMGTFFLTWVHFSSHCTMQYGYIFCHLLPFWQQLGSCSWDHPCCSSLHMHTWPAAKWDCMLSNGATHSTSRGKCTYMLTCLWNRMATSQPLAIINMTCSSKWRRSIVFWLPFRDENLSTQPSLQAHASQLLDDSADLAN